MPSNFLDLPREIRNMIYEEVLVVEDPIELPARSSYKGLPRDGTAIGILLVNKVIYLEATAMLYGQNHFDITTCPPDEVRIFLETIGRRNASCILHIILEFPGVDYWHSNNLKISDDDLGLLANLRSGCTNLRTLTTSLMSTDNAEIILDSVDSTQAISEALATVNTHFRVISSLKEIIIEVYEVLDPVRSFRDEMKGLGWTVSAVEYRYDSDNDSYESESVAAVDDLDTEDDPSDFYDETLDYDFNHGYDEDFTSSNEDDYDCFNPYA